jgi:ATP-dependent RNA helicase DDX3X
MFSATFPPPVRKLARDFLQKEHKFVSVGRVGSTTKDITQRVSFDNWETCERILINRQILEVDGREKMKKLEELLLSGEAGLTLIFVQTKKMADTIDFSLFKKQFPVTSIHGDRTQAEREDALIAFKTGKAPILVATEVAARGLDIPNVQHVINYDLPSSIDDYVHRIGRTGRAGNKGLATSFYSRNDDRIASDLVKILSESEQEIPSFLSHYQNGAR